jgi:hypothetical protein
MRGQVRAALHSPGPFLLRVSIGQVEGAYAMTLTLRRIKDDFLVLVPT